MYDNVYMTHDNWRAHAGMHACILSLAHMAHLHAACEPQDDPLHHPSNTSPFWNLSIQYFLPLLFHSSVLRPPSSVFRPPYSNLSQPFSRIFFVLFGFVFLHNMPRRSPVTASLSSQLKIKTGVVQRFVSLSSFSTCSFIFFLSSPLCIINT